MKLWRKAAGAIKDKNSIFAATLSRRTSFRHPDLEAIIVKATSHDDSKLDYKNVRRVFEWIRTSPIYLKPLAWALSSRMDKTRSWVVAIKGLMLIHGVICCRLPAVQRIGRLPFDLSSFKDGHSHKSKTWGFDAFVRSYYAFLDQKFYLVSGEGRKFQRGKRPPLMEELQRLKNWQMMLDLLLQVRPLAENMRVVLILESMNNLVIEVFDVYSKICNGVSLVLMKIYSSPARTEASMALRIIKKAVVQVDELSEYFDLCKKIGVLNSSQCPKLDKIPEDDIKELEQIINGGGTIDGRREIEEEKMAVVERERENVGEAIGKDSWKTVITEEWEIFDGELPIQENPFVGSNLIVSRENFKTDHLPDLITF